MQVNLTEEEMARIEALAAKLPEAEVRGVPKKDRPRVVLYRAIAAGLAALESALSAEGAGR